MNPDNYEEPLTETGDEIPTEEATIEVQVVTPETISDRVKKDNQPRTMNILFSNFEAAAKKSGRRGINNMTGFVKYADIVQAYLINTQDDELTPRDLELKLNFVASGFDDIKVFRKYLNTWCSRKWDIPLDQPAEA
jgi:hypothetical protein